MGLANRVVPQGHARQSAEELAGQLAQFPQTCMRNDRLSAYESYERTFTDAMRYEFTVGMQSLQEDGLNGAARFAGGAGRHGVFDDVSPD